ncbi:helix-turn-helix domain-containing protein [Streptomyces sp. NBC_01310]|uniref:helix-turn-helix domain-containing protein n=1 Tax=Streptomyces sp. NBC_01310 TaxID=2903820 RepID=UPI0035B6625C|nr:helix-turn-helix domain-containing protein [Streptomyces sp. NBC_01310]
MVGNHLLQHPELSAMAIGVAAYIQSLPDGAPVGINALTERFPEGEVRVAAALRELERYGYLERRRERLATGQVVTRTYSYNRPGNVGPEGQTPTPPPTPTPTPPPPPPPTPPPPPSPGREPAPEPVPGPVPQPVPEPEPEPDVRPGPVTARAPDVPPAPPRPLHPGAADLLAGLRRYDPRLLLAERDVRRLAPAVSAWLERGAAPDEVGRILTGGLPEDMRRPASVLAYRLTELIPPHLPPAPAARPVRRPDPFQTCDGCDRAFRAPAPGRCRDCPPDPERAAKPAA